MKDLGRLDARSSKLDGVLDAALKGASGPDADRIRLDQALNHQAYFVLCWRQLEVAIDEACREVIRRRRSRTDWQIRRGWDLYNSDDPRLSGLTFEGRASLVLDQAEGRGQPYSPAMRHYEARNRIAHGKLDHTRIDLASVIQDFHAIQSALHRAM